MQPKSDRSGRVKIRGPLYSDKITDSDVIIIDDEEGGSINDEEGGGRENTEGTGANDMMLTTNGSDEEEEETDDNPGVADSCEEEEDIGEESDDAVMEQVAKKQKVDGRSTSGRSPQFTASQVVEGLDGYYNHIDDNENKRNGMATKKGYARVCKTKFKRPDFHVKTLRNWLKDERYYREQAVKTQNYRRGQAKPRERTGKYPEMELRLATNIRYLRSLGMPVASWMIDFEAKLILHEFYPEQCPSPEVEHDPAAFSFKCSDTWRINFMKRHKFSVRKIGTKMNKKGVTPVLMEKIREYHIATRAFQLSENNDSVYGFTSPPFVFSHDQVPIELADKNETTIDNLGIDEVYDSTGKDEDRKRFCTLNLFGGMDYGEDYLGNAIPIPKPHLVFKGKYQSGDDWHDKSEIEEWDSRVVVSFQENAWVDAKTHRLGLDKVLGPIDAHLSLNDHEMKGVVFEDNLSSHHTEDVMQHWKDNLPNFVPPRFVPANMTDIVQVVDRHIGVRYKQAVYLAFRTEMMRRLKAAQEAAGGADGIIIPKLTPREKRIIITKAVAAEHEKLVNTDVWKRGFIATATWMPVSHLRKDDEGNFCGLANIPEESEVKLQHLPEYNYEEQCSRATVVAAADAAKLNEENARGELERIASVEQEKIEFERVLNAPFVNKADNLMGELTEVLSTLITDDLTNIYLETGHEEFLIGGSWASAKIVQALLKLLPENEDLEELNELVTNDCDLFYGEFTTDYSKSFAVDLNSTKDYVKSDELDVDINTVKARNISPSSFLANNDINITASCLHVNFAIVEGSLFTVHASPCFWKLVFDISHRIIQPVNIINAGNYKLTTLVRIAYKAFQMKQFDYSFGKVDITTLADSKLTLAKSQKSKFDEMKDWVRSPFLEYKCNPRQNGSYFAMAKKHTKVNCVSTIGQNGVSCGGRANSKCSHKMCKKCCIKRTNENGSAKCKVKEHWVVDEAPTEEVSGSN